MNYESENNLTNWVLASGLIIGLTLPMIFLGGPILLSGVAVCSMLFSWLAKRSGTPVTPKSILLFAILTYIFSTAIMLASFVVLLHFDFFNNFEYNPFNSAITSVISGYAWVTAWKISRSQVKNDDAKSSISHQKPTILIAVSVLSLALIIPQMPWLISLPSLYVSGFTVSVTAIAKMIILPIIALILPYLSFKILATKQPTRYIWFVGILSILTIFANGIIYLHDQTQLMNADNLINFAYFSLFPVITLIVAVLALRKVKTISAKLLPINQTFAKYGKFICWAYYLSLFTYFLICELGGVAASRYYYL